MPAKSTIRIGAKQLALSNLDKLYYPDAGFTKGDVIDYYSRIAPVLLPHVRDRPMALKRYPDGVDGQHFYQKNCPAHRPDWIKTVSVPRESGRPDPVQYCVITDRASLLWMVNLASIEMHVQLAKVKTLHQPAMMIFDLDPGPGTDILDCLRIALQVRQALEFFKLRCFAKTSGSKGIHIAVPLNTPATFEQTRPFARELAMVLERQDPKRLTTTMSKSKRRGKVFIDWSQNDAHKTTVSVYSLRARPRPAVSMPISWDQVQRALKKKDASAVIAEAAPALQRIEREGDLFEPVLKLKQKLPGMGK